MRVAAFAWLPIALVVTTHGAEAQKVTKEKVLVALPKLDQLAGRLIAEDHVPGMAIAVVYRDQVVFLKGYGVRQAGKPEPVDPDTVFQLASLSKPISSTIVAKIVGDGTLSWDARIHDLDPTFMLYDPSATTAATVRDLFAHRSGLWGDAGNDIEDLGFEREDIIYRLRFLKPVGKLRERFDYSNFGLTAGALAAAKAAHASWEDLAQSELFVPLGMPSTSARYVDFLSRPDRAALHVRVDGKWAAKVKRQPDAQAPAGGVSSSVRDLAQWMRLQLGNGAVDGHTLVKSEALAQTHARVVSRGKSPVSGQPVFYGLGWGTEESAHGVLWNHSGAFSAGARTAVSLAPSEQLGILVLCNAFPSGVPEGLAAEFFDLAFNGELSRDWLADWDKFVESTYGRASIDAAIAPYAKPPAAPMAALPASAYAGTYSNDYLGSAVVESAGSSLVMSLGPRGLVVFPLKHFDRNLFLIYPSEEVPTLPSSVEFTIGPDGRASEVVISSLNGDGQGRMLRSPK